MDFWSLSQSILGLIFHREEIAERSYNKEASTIMQTTLRNIFHIEYTDMMPKNTPYTGSSLDVGTETCCNCSILIMHSLTVQL